MALRSFLAKGPRYLATYAGWRLKRRLAGCSRTAQWPTTDAVLQSIGRFTAAREPGAQAALDHYRTRTNPRPLCPPAFRAELVASVPETQRALTIRHAENVVARRFSFRGEDVSFPDGAVDWKHRPQGNIDWMRDLNRHHYFVTLGRAYWYTGDERFAEAFRDLLLDWMEHNPPHVRSPNWEGVFETSVRVANWCWAHSLLIDSPTLDPEAHLTFLRGVAGMGGFLSRHLEVHSWNNHLLLEAKALLMLGRLYPELPGSARWRRRGLRCLREQLARQVVSDGVHSERTSHYHRLVTSELLEHVIVGELSGAKEEDASIREDLHSLATFLAALTRVDGSLPMLGDSSRADEHVHFDSLRGAAALLDDATLQGDCRATPPDLEEGTRWLLGSLEMKLAPQGAAGDDSRSHAFAAGGYWVLHSRCGERALHAVFDCGPFSDPIVYGHGHADALSVDLAVGPHNFVLDPGMYSAYMGLEWRNYFRGSSAHNTVMVDGRDQTILRGAKRAYRQAPTEHRAWLTHQRLDVVCGLHRGYERLPEPVTHERCVVFVKDRYWLLLDTLAGSGDHRYDLLFHLLPNSEPTIDPETGAVCVRRADGYGLMLYPLTGETPTIRAGEVDPPQGWVSFQSGVKEPAPVVEYSVTAPAPRSLVTLLLPLWPQSETLPTVDVLRRDGSRAVARIDSDGWQHELLLQPGEWNARRGSFVAEGVSTDGICAILERTSGGGVAFAAAVGGTRLEHVELPALTATRGAAVWNGTAWHELGQATDGHGAT